MKNKFFLKSIIVILILLIILSCSSTDVYGPNYGNLSENTGAGSEGSGDSANSSGSGLQVSTVSASEMFGTVIDQDEHVNDYGGFTYTIQAGYGVFPYLYNPDLWMTTLNHPNGNIHFYICGDSNSSQFNSDEEVASFWIKSMFLEHGIQVEQTKGKNVRVDGHKTKAINLSGESLAGQVVAIRVSGNQYFFVLGFAEDENAQKVWDDIGQKEMNTLLKSVEFEN